MIFNKLINNLTKFARNKAFFINDAFISYDTLSKHIFSIKSLLDEKCIKGEIIGIVTNDDVQTYAAILAIWFSGKGYVPLNSKFPVQRNIEIIKQAKLSTIVGTQISNEYNRFCSESEIEIISIGDIQLKQVEFTEIKLNDNSIAYLLFTSGSTGIPKGVPITFKNLISFVDSFEKTGIKIGEEDHCLQMFDLSFDVSVAMLILPLLSGACIFTIPNTGIKLNNIYKIILKQNITFLVIVPSLLSFLKPYMQEIHLLNVQTCIMTAEASTQNLLE
jgi:D-alanine--poly(phosphoribitol) ligase subunit 1